MKNILKRAITLWFLIGFSFSVEAVVIRIISDTPVIIEFDSFGDTGAYEKITGIIEGEIDPNDRRHRDITDIELAPTTNGMVFYRAPFYILRPTDPRKANGRIFYAVGNRGAKRALQWLNDAQASNDPMEEGHFGHGFLMREGYTIVMNGYAGHVRGGPNILGAELPIATNPDGSTITGKVVTEMVPGKLDDTSIQLPYAANEVKKSNGVLTVREHGNGTGTSIKGWHYVDEWKIAISGPVKPGWIYEFVYTAKDPIVMGMGHAITRDFLSFLRHHKQDRFGNPGPLDDYDVIKAIYSWGRSNGGRTQRDFLRWGFNEDEQGRRVIDGMIPYGTGAAGHLWMNWRFAQPMASSRKHERHYAPEHEFPQTFPVLTDPLTGQIDGILRRCLKTNTCPKILHVDGANEYWNKLSSLNHTDAMGNDLDLETLAPNVRVYSIAATEHNTNYDQTMPETMRSCQQMTNPLYNGTVFRALLVKMDEWVTENKQPPASIVPSKQDGTLVPPEAVIYPKIPALNYDGWPSLPEFIYTSETMYRYGPLDFSNVPYKPVTDNEYVAQVSQVDADGNELAGVRLPGLIVPLGTHLGWSVMKDGSGFPDSCGQHGSFIPFAKTREERIAMGDPRPSLEERYGDEEAFAEKIESAANELMKQGFLLREDVERITRRARENGFDYWKVPLPK